MTESPPPVRPPPSVLSSSSRGGVRRCVSSCASTVVSPVLDAFRSIPTLPWDVRMMFATLFFLFISWFTTWMYYPAFMGVEIYGGRPDPSLDDDDPLKAAYNDGARAYSFGMLFASCVTLVLAFLMPVLAEAMGEIRVLFVAELLHVAVLYAANVISDHTLAIANVALLGVPFSAFLVIPYALVGRAAKASAGGEGKVMATMNLFMCLPELAVSLIVSPVVAAVGGSLRMPMVVSTIACVGALATIFFGFGDGWHGSWLRGRLGPASAASKTTEGSPEDGEEASAQARCEAVVATHEARICTLEAKLEELQQRLDSSKA